jgi:hypothetical protein
MIGGCVGDASGSGDSPDGRGDSLGDAGAVGVDGDAVGLGCAAGAFEIAGDGVGSAAGALGDGVGLVSGAPELVGAGGVGGAGRVDGAGGVGGAGSGVGEVCSDGVVGAALGATGGLTGPDGDGAGGFPCAAAASANTQTNARLENGARTRRKRLLIRDRFYAIF